MAVAVGIWIALGLVSFVLFAAGTAVPALRKRTTGAVAKGGCAIWLVGSVVILLGPVFLAVLGYQLLARKRG